MRKRIRVIGSGAIASLLTLVIGVPLYAANNHDPMADFGRSVEFEPLVRHMMSQVHCYDMGTDDCERDKHHDSDFTKEHTLGFLLDGSRKKLDHLEPVYLCKSRDDSHTMMVTAGTTEADPKRACREEGFSAHHAGYIAAEADDIEAPFAIYRCTHPDTDDTLLTDDPAECTAQSYDPAELLGYLYAGGPLLLEP